MYWRRAARCSAPKSTMRTEKKPTRSSKRRGIIGCAGRRTMLQCASTLVGGRGTPWGAGGTPGPVGVMVPVCVASTSTLSGKARARPMDLAADRGDVGDARREEARHVDHRRAVLAIGLDVEDGDDRRIVRRLHRAIDGERAVGRDRERGRAENDL